MITIPLGLILISVIAMLFLSLKYKNKITYELAIAALLSLIWVTTSGIYDYRGENYLFYNLNLLPFILWTFGLVILREIYEKIKKQNYAFIKAVVIYWALLILIEYFGYGLLGIQLNSNYPGLFNMPFLHAPLFAQIYYLSIGPIYLLITDWLGVK